jgi:hypothetical protein
MANTRELSFVDQGSPNGSKAGQSSFKSRVAHGKAPEGEREFGILAPVAKRLLPPIFSVPEGRVAQAGLSIVDRREQPVPL